MRVNNRESIEFQVICIINFLAKVMKKMDGLSKYGLVPYCS